MATRNIRVDFAGHLTAFPLSRIENDVFKLQKFNIYLQESMADLTYVLNQLQDAYQRIDMVIRDQDNTLNVQVKDFAEIKPFHATRIFELIKQNNGLIDRRTELAKRFAQQKRQIINARFKGFSEKQKNIYVPFEDFLNYDCSSMGIPEPTILDFISNVASRQDIYNAGGGDDHEEDPTVDALFSYITCLHALYAELFPVSTNPGLVADQRVARPTFKPRRPKDIYSYATVESRNERLRSLIIIDSKETGVDTKYRNLKRSLKNRFNNT